MVLAAGVEQVDSIAPSVEQLASAGVAAVSPPVGLDQVFVGRQRELRLLSVMWDEARAGRPHVVSVEGPPGIGKTTLLSRFLHDIERCCVLQASGEEAEAGLALGVVQQLAGHLDDQLSHRSRVRNEGRPPTAALTVGAALVDVLGTLQEDGPVLVAVDDLHWADRPSLQALTFALRRLRVDRVLVVVSTRDLAEPRVPEGLRRLLAGPASVRLRLGGLDAAELRALGAWLGVGRLPARAAARLRDHTHGNPLHACALMEELPVEILHSGEASLPAPRSFAMLVLGRLAAAAPAAERLVTAGAVLGVRSPLRLARRLAGLDDPLPALNQAVTAHLLKEHHAGGEQQIAFPHPLVRAAVYHALGPARRAVLHRRARPSWSTARRPPSATAWRPRSPRTQRSPASWTRSPADRPRPGHRRPPPATWWPPPGSAPPGPAGRSGC